MMVMKLTQMDELEVGLAARLREYRAKTDATTPTARARIPRGGGGRLKNDAFIASVGSERELICFPDPKLRQHRPSLVAGKQRGKQLSARLFFLLPLEQGDVHSELTCNKALELIP